LNLHGFWLPQSGDIVTVPEGSQVLFACPGGTVNGPGTTEALLTCTGGKTFAVRVFNFMINDKAKNEFAEVFILAQIKY